MKEEYVAKLLERHKAFMEETRKKNPMLILRVTLLKQERVAGRTLATFNVIKTSEKIKLSEMVEEKIRGKGKLTGTVVSTQEGTITVSFPHPVHKDTNELVRNPNYNNQILLEEGEKFLKSKKKIHKCFYAQQEEEQEKSVELFNKNLNDSQANAVKKSMITSPFKLLGPPGTGKTETIVEIISQHLNKGHTLLVCGPSNTSVDNIIIRMQSSPFYLKSNTLFYRLGSSTKGLYYLNLEYMADKSVEFMNEEESEIEKYKEKKAFTEDKNKRKREFISQMRSSPLVFSTLFSSLKENRHFDVCIVDEACQGAELETFLAITKASTFILVGDPYQLSPISTSSLYNTLDLPLVILTTQYRMPASMISFSNSQFYNNVIISPKSSTILFNNKSVLFVDTSFCGYSEEQSGTSRINLSEAAIICSIVEWIKKNVAVSPNDSLGIIVPYSAQVYHLSTLLESFHNVSVDTVDGFQGQERDFIILGFVRSNSTREIGFLSDKRRLNVAITRAKKGLVVVADAETFKKDSFFRAFFSHLEENAVVIDPESLFMMLE